jgi:DUF971 family protein
MLVQLNSIAIFNEEAAFSFDDGEETFMLLEYMRKMCPCAVCQGEPDVMGRTLVKHKNYSADSYRLVKFSNVGGYAIQFYWGDGHSSGIYSYSYIKSIANDLP